MSLGLDLSTYELILGSASTSSEHLPVCTQVFISLEELTIKNLIFCSCFGKRESKQELKMRMRVSNLQFATTMI